MKSMNYFTITIMYIFITNGNAYSAVDAANRMVQRCLANKHIDSMIVGLAVRPAPAKASTASGTATVAQVNVK